MPGRRGRASTLDGDGEDLQHRTMNAAARRTLMLAVVAAWLARGLAASAHELRLGESYPLEPSPCSPS